MHSALKANGDRARGLADVGSLVDFHRSIEQHLVGLRRSREGRPVYGLEHSLNQTEIIRLNQLVGNEIRDRGIGSNFNGSYLALVVVASEVGYEYRGTGTDFWPKFEQALGAKIASHEREHVTHFFETAHRLHGIRKPADSSWTRAFRHIAWPIVNAVAPREIHRALAQTLRESYRLGSDVPEEEVLVSRLRSIAGRTAAPRFVHWLENGDLAAAVAWRLLEQTDPYSRIADDTLGRIFGDLVTDSVARRAVAGATALHRRRAQTASKKVATLGAAQLVITDSENGKIELGVQLPYLSSADRSEIRNAMSRAGGKLRLWGVTEPVDTERFLSGFPFVLGGVDLVAIAETELPFIALNPDATEVHAQTVVQLAPNLSTPIVLVRVGLSAKYAQTVLRSIPEGTFRVLLAGSEAPPAFVNPKGKIGGLRCFEVGQCTPDIIAWLEHHGLGRARSASIQFSGPVLLGQNLHGPVFPEGQPVLVKVDSKRPATFTMRGLPTTIVAAGTLLAIYDAPAGSHVVEVEVGGEQVRAGFTVVRTEQIDPILSVSLDPPAPTADDLIDGQLGLHFRSTVELGSVEIEIIAYDGGIEIARTSQRVFALPVSIGPSSATMQALVEQLRKVSINRSSKPEFSIVVGKAWQQRWFLDWKLRHCEWESIDGEWRALTEDQDLPVITSTGFDPFGAADGIGVGSDGPLLQIPVLDGIVLLDEALCTAPMSMLLSKFAIDVPERLLREPASRGKALGIIPCLEAWLGWASAKSEHIVADFGRRRVASRIEELAVSQLCGEHWTALEQAGSVVATSPWLTLTQLAMARNLAAGGILPDTPASDKPRLERLVAEALERARPDLWSSPDLSDKEDLAGQLDMAVIDAYERLAALIVSEGRSPIDDPDANGDPEVWLTAVRDAGERHRVAAQRVEKIEKLILPSSRARALVSADYDLLGESDLLSLLAETHIDLSLRSPNWLDMDALDTALSIWIAPRAVVSRPDWKLHAERLLADRQTARATRYVALRYRTARSMDSRS